MSGALTITITRDIIGGLAVMILLAILVGFAVCAITGIIAFTHMDSGGKFAKLAELLQWPLIVMGAVFGAALGFWLMLH